MNLKDTQTETVMRISGLSNEFSHVTEVLTLLIT
jgi:hypothetical protein